jgi:hypothetical protein
MEHGNVVDDSIPSRIYDAIPNANDDGVTKGHEDKHR